MFKRYAICLLTICLSVTTLSTPALAANHTIKLATLLPEGSHWMRALRKASTQIKQETDGRVTLKLYPGGVMGDDKTVLRKIRIGQLQASALTAAQMAKHSKAGQIYYLPTVFKNYEEIDQVRPHIDNLLVNDYKKNGFTVFGISEFGFGYILSKKRLNTLEDLRASKVWIPSNDKGAETIANTFNISPVPLPLPDVLTGLQTQLIDTVGISLSAALALQWHTQLKYIVDIPLMYLYGLIIIPNKVFNRLTLEDQAVITRIFKQITKEVDARTRQDNVASLEALKKQGLEVISLPASEQEIVMQRAQKSWQKLIKTGVITQDIFDLLQQHLHLIRQ